MKQLFKLGIIICGLIASGSAQALDATFYLVRHAEKQDDGTRDPALTEAGTKRAQTIADMLKTVDLTAVYSTNYKRTRSTAQPTAKQAGLELKFYDPRQLEAFADKLKTLSGNFLIVGHSNTTPVLAGALTGQAMEEIQHHQYDRIYIVTVSDEGEAKLSLKFSEPRTP